jgi:hypothetical protein
MPLEERHTPRAFNNRETHRQNRHSQGGSPAPVSAKARCRICAATTPGRLSHTLTMAPARPLEPFGLPRQESLPVDRKCPRRQDGFQAELGELVVGGMARSPSLCSDTVPLRSARGADHSDPMFTAMALLQWLVLPCTELFRTPSILLLLCV